MEIPNEKAEFSSKLVMVLRKITESQFKVLHNIHLEKLLTNFRSEYGCIQVPPPEGPQVRFSRGAGDGQALQPLLSPSLPVTHTAVNQLLAISFSKWLSETLLLWKTQNLTAEVAGFIYQFIGILCKNEEDFNLIFKKCLIELPDVLKSDNISNISLRVAYLRLLVDIASHKSGCEWLMSSKQWKTAFNLCYSNCSFYVEKEGLLFFRKLVLEMKSEFNILSEIFNEILFFISQKEKILNENNEEFLKTRLSLRMLREILKAFIISNSSAIVLKFLRNLDIENFFKFVLDNNINENLLEETCIFYTLFLILQYDQQYLLSISEIPENVLSVFKNLQERGKNDTIMQLSKFCQLLWSEMRNAAHSGGATAVNFVAIQLLFVSTYIKHPQDSEVFDFFVRKVFNLLDDKSLKFIYYTKEKIETKTNSREWALKGVSSLTRNFGYLNNDEAVLIFQTFVYVLKVFVPDICEMELSQLDPKTLEEEYMRCKADASLLSAILNALCNLVDKFNINWTESLESLCILKMGCKLLENSYLSSVLAVQTLLLMKLAISNFMSPNLALLLNKTEDSGFECPMSLLYKRLQDASWEIRDSCIEVLTTIIELAETKYPAYQQLLMEEDFCSSMFNLVEFDSESYVRGSALRALSAMTKIENIRPRINNPDFLAKITNLLKSESEGIVRREAVILITQIYLSKNEEPDFVSSFYETLGYSAVYDLHWEVKVNALIFWAKVIDKVLADQGMIDGSFPKVTFSKEHKKIVNLTSEEIKLRLRKALEKLSDIGCLHVLLSTLHDDCDLQVIQKSVQILSDFVSNLKRYGVVSKSRDNFRIPPKRKCMSPETCEQRKSPAEIFCDDSCLNELDGEIANGSSYLDSDAVIEEIVNEMDINLLVSVCAPHETKSNADKKVLLKKIKPESFLQKMQDFDFDKFLNDKRKWFVENDLNSLVDDIILVNSTSKNNVMDCY